MSKPSPRSRAPRGSRCTVFRLASYKGHGAGNDTTNSDNDKEHR